VAHETGSVVVMVFIQPCGWVASKKQCGLVVLIKGKKDGEKLKFSSNVEYIKFLQSPEDNTAR
jgi:hypothetical protein